MTKLNNRLTDNIKKGTLIKVTDPNSHVVQYAEIADDEIGVIRLIKQFDYSNVLSDGDSSSHSVISYKLRNVYAHEIVLVDERDVGSDFKRVVHTTEQLKLKQKLEETVTDES